MREHGVLSVSAVYDEAVAALMRGRIWTRWRQCRYHSHVIEDYTRSWKRTICSRFERAGQLTDLTKVLREQHQAGRRVTDRIRYLATAQTLQTPESAVELRTLLRLFTRMYEPHEAREDTLLFPALRTIVSGEEYGALGKDFEKKEHQLFGDDGFEKIVDRVAGIENRLGIYDLAQFTPAT